MKENILKLIVFCACFCQTFAWDNDELEMFDLVEEVNENFYTIIGVDQSASSSEIRKSYRQLSLQIHPDKNKNDDAEIKFRQLTAIYAILKDKERRKQYDFVLENGMPDWRQPVFYYRRVKKLGLLEIAILLVVIFTVGHYLVMWASYIEKRFVAEELFNDRKKKKEKKKKSRQTGAAADDEEDLLQEQLSTIPRPVLTDILPIKLTLSVVWLVTSLPVWWREHQEEKRRIQEEEEAEILMQQAIDEEIRAEKDRAKNRVRKRVGLPEKPNGEEGDSAAGAYMPVGEEALAAAHEEKRKQQCKVGEWTDEDHQLLAKACTRFPGGTVSRWEKMAAFLNRPVKEVIQKVAERKGGYVKTVDTASQGITGAMDENAGKKKVIMVPKDGVISTRDEEGSTTTTMAAAPKKIKPSQKTPDSSVKESMPSKETKETKETKESESKDEWTQNQQKVFEWGLSNFPKGTSERWAKIAEHIPGKNKDDCVARFKYLADLVRKRKQQQPQKT